MNNGAFAERLELSSTDDVGQYALANRARDAYEEILVAFGPCLLNHAE